MKSTHVCGDSSLSARESSASITTVEHEAIGRPLVDSAVTPYSNTAPPPGLTHGLG